MKRALWIVTLVALAALPLVVSALNQPYYLELARRSMRCRSVFLSFVCWMNRSCSGCSPGAAIGLL